jgi:hypothetical protein
VLVEVNRNNIPAPIQGRWPSILLSIEPDLLSI